MTKQSMAKMEAGAQVFAACVDTIRALDKNKGERVAQRARQAAEQFRNEELQKEERVRSQTIADQDQQSFCWWFLCQAIWPQEIVLG